MNKEKTKSLSRSVITACTAFVALLITVLSIATYRIYTGAMYERYQKQLASLVSYVEAHIDHDDMAECARTYVESEKYKVFQAFFDDLIDHYEGIHYLYLMQVLGPDAPVSVREICAANSTYEKENDPDMVLHLGDGEADWFTEETVRQYRAILEGGEDVYFVNSSTWSVDYTLARPVRNTAGEIYGLLCADISVDELQNSVYQKIYINIALIVIPGILFIVLFLLWLRRNVTRPLKLLENSVTEFAGKSTGKRNPDELLFNPPEIHTRNEVQSLSEAFAKLSGDMRDYIKGIVAAEDETRGLQAHMTVMNEIAYQDALTKVKNKAAYDKKKQELAQDIADQAAEFGIVMVDLNNLKGINDRHGHERGNAYIVGACKLLCRVFKHSPVYRVGGDEFVAVIQGADYRNRDALLKELRESFAESMTNGDAPPWQRYSAATGLSVYQPGDDVEAVFNRADQEMYRMKAEMKMGREESPV